MVAPLLGVLLSSFGKSMMNLVQGFAFGTGYGSGVRFGYEDVYPKLKGLMSTGGELGKIPFFGSGFRMSSGLNKLPS